MAHHCNHCGKQDETVHLFVERIQDRRTGYIHFMCESCFTSDAPFPWHGCKSYYLCRPSQYDILQGIPYPPVELVEQPPTVALRSTDPYEFGDIHEIKLQTLVGGAWAFAYDDKDGEHLHGDFIDPFEALSAAVAHLSTMAFLQEAAKGVA